MLFRSLRDLREHLRRRRGGRRGRGEAVKAPDNRVAMENDRPRIDVRERVIGQARFTADVRLPRML